MMSETCVFCEIVSGDAKSHKIWEDENHLAFLSIYPNTAGVTVVIPKKHYSSYAFDLPQETLIALTLAARNVAKLLDEKLNDVGRTAMVFEGFGVDHVHAKLFPMHGTKIGIWKPLKSDKSDFFTQYPGYISSHDAKRAEDQELATLALELKK
jgi:histidine triad (HIT) family protein